MKKATITLGTKVYSLLLEVNDRPFIVFPSLGVQVEMTDDAIGETCFIAGITGQSRSEALVNHAVAILTGDAEDGTAHNINLAGLGNVKCYGFTGGPFVRELVLTSNEDTVDQGLVDIITKYTDSADATGTLDVVGVNAELQAAIDQRTQVAVKA